MLEIINATIKCGEKQLFKPLSLTVKPKEVCVLSAPSGTGKTSLLRWIAGINTDGLTGTGKILLHGKSIDTQKPEHRRIGLMFQSPLLFPHLNIKENLGFGLSAQIKGKKRSDMIKNALARSGLAGIEERDPATLSGGQQTRIALLRCLLAEPEALLLDEPFSSLDDKRRDQIVSLVLAEANRLSLPILLVSHDPRDSAISTKKPITLTAL